MEMEEKTDVKNFFVTVSPENVASVNVKIEEAELEPYKKHYVKDKQKHVEIRGYRKGKAPENMVASYFKQEAREFAKNNAIYAKYSKLLQDHKLQPLAYPQLGDVKDENGNIEAVLTVEVIQPVVLNQYMGLEIKSAPKINLDEQFNNALKNLRHTYPKLVVENNGMADNGKVALLDFIMTKDGKEYEKQVDLKAALGANLFLRDFEAQLIGLKAGEQKSFDILFPESYHKEELRNATVNFSVNIKEIYTIGDYTDEELAGVLQLETKEKLFETLKNELSSQNADNERHYYENQILEKLLSDHKFNIPKTLIDNEVSKIKAEKADLTDEEVRNIADRFVRTDLILGTIYERHPDIQLNQEEFNKRFEELAKRANDSVENTVNKLRSGGQLQSYLNYLKNNKVIDFLIEMADKKEESVEVKEKENG